MKRTKNTVLHKERERHLSRIATRGVVKFFNVVKQQQKDIEVKLKQAGSFDRKKDKVYSSIDKKSFLERLKESNNDEDDLDIDETKKQENGNKPKWNVLRDDFMMGGEAKDWDKVEDDDDDDDLNDDEDSDTTPIKINDTKKANNNNNNKKNMRNGRNKRFKK